MGKEQLASKIKALRKSKGFSQEQLAMASALSLRTVQRIENGETVPHGDSLKKPTQALGVSMHEVLEPAVPEARGYLLVMNIAVLACFYHPLLSVLIPLIIWLLKRDQFSVINASGKKLINFQLTCLLFFAIVSLIANGGRYIAFNVSLRALLSAIIFKFSFLNFLIGIVYLYNLILVVVNIQRSRKNICSIYFPAIRFLK